ncbi:MAG: 4Fe-4S dicluster domain-containing protein [Candidatus Kariarchaeaceae archaeon]|jgi:molybdopterin-containing oxidoreductase family iron-sulfur binding subunit
MKVTRRDFLKGLAVAGSAVALTDLSALAIDKDGTNQGNRPYDQWRIEDSEWMMVIDLGKCDGCVDVEVPRCTQSCIDGHYTPDEAEYIKVFEVEHNEYSKKSYFPRPCQQCLDPPCVHICPVGAAWQRDGDRLTLIDQTRCIGCRLCMAACPYDVRFLHWEDNPKADQIPQDQYESQMPFSLVKERGVVVKCEFCGLQFVGLLPHCVTSCHTGALYFGNIKENAVTNRDDETHKIDELIEARGGYRWKDEEGTRPRVFYLPESTAKGEE